MSHRPPVPRQQHDARRVPAAALLPGELLGARPLPAGHRRHGDQPPDGVPVRHVPCRQVLPRRHRRRRLLRRLRVLLRQRDPEPNHHAGGRGVPHRALLPRGHHRAPAVQQRHCAGSRRRPEAVGLHVVPARVHVRGRQPHPHPVLARAVLPRQQRGGAVRCDDAQPRRPGHQRDVVPAVPRWLPLPREGHLARGGLPLPRRPLLHQGHQLACQVSRRYLPQHHRRLGSGGVHDLPRRLHLRRGRCHTCRVPVQGVLPRRLVRVAALPRRVLLPACHHVAPGLPGGQLLPRGGGDVHPVPGRSLLPSPHRQPAGVPAGLELRQRRFVQHQPHQLGGGVHGVSCRHLRRRHRRHDMQYVHRRVRVLGPDPQRHAGQHRGRQRIPVPHGALLPRWVVAGARVPCRDVQPPPPHGQQQRMQAVRREHVQPAAWPSVVPTMQLQLHLRRRLDRLRVHRRVPLVPVLGRLLCVPAGLRVLRHGPEPRDRRRRGGLPARCQRAVRQRGEPRRQRQLCDHRLQHRVRVWQRHLQRGHQDVLLRHARPGRVLRQHLPCQRADGCRQRPDRPVRRH